MVQYPPRFIRIASLLVDRPVMGRIRGGSPAWAGIDLEVNTFTVEGGRLPRVGGDRPWYNSDDDGETWAPPRGRG